MLAESERAIVARALAALASHEDEALARALAQLDPNSGWSAALRAARAQRDGHLDEALSAWSEAIARAPDLLFARQNRARLLEHLNRYAEALADLEAARAVAPEDPLIRADRGRLLWRLGHLDEARRELESALAQKPDLVPALNDLGLVLLAQGYEEEALQKFAEATAYDPAYLPARLNQVEFLVRRSRHEEAVAVVEAARAAGANAAELLYWYGCALRGCNRHEEALAALEAATALAPDHARAHCERGLVLIELDRESDALTAFQQSLACADDEPATHLGRAVALMRLGRGEEALHAVDRALALDPAYFEALVERGNILRVLGRPSEALKAYDDALALKPGDPVVHSNRGNIFMDLGRFAEARAAFEQALHFDPSMAAAFDNLLWCSCFDPSLDRVTVVAAHRRFGERFGNRRDRYRSWENERCADRPLRIGFVSADLNRHPVGFMLAPILEALDHERFAVFFYFTGSIEDSVSTRLKRIGRAWHRVGGLSDRALAELVRQEKIDILVDLAGHTAGNRLLCFALKPAPVQATWLGYPFTTGLSEIDWIIMDPVSVAPGEEDAFSERVIHLAGGRFVLNPPESAPDLQLPPSLLSGRLTFASFNNVSKLTREVIVTWATILRRLPASTLLLKWKTLADPEVVQEVRAAFAAEGVDPARLILRPASGYLEMLAEYNDVDIALDPFPFGGGQTTLDALWMGVPVVTLPSWQPVSRQGAMMLTAIRRPEWIADDPADYVEVALELAADPARLAGMRLGQREQVRRSPLCDGARAARELECAFKEMWRDWLERVRA